MTFYAHSLENQPTEKWQKLDDHLQNVADLAADFATVFDARDWARAAAQAVRPRVGQSARRIQAAARVLGLRGDDQ